MSTEKRTVGVEEEFLLHALSPGVGNASGRQLMACGTPRDQVVGSGDEGTIKHEFHTQQLETNTAPHLGLAALQDSLGGWRIRAAALAAEENCVLLPSGTPPVAMRLSVRDTRRGRAIARRFGMPAVDGAACGLHVHVQIGSEDEGVAVLDRIRAWLPLLLALSANSPFWHGRDTGYASYRARLLGGWPMSGPTPLFGSTHEHRVWRNQLLATGVPLDEAMLYADARLSCRFPTVEVRVMDVPLRASTSVLLAGLVRALVDTASANWLAGEPPLSHSSDLLRLASWQAARFGLSQDLLDPSTMRPVPADRACSLLLEHVGAALEANGDLERCKTGTRQLVRRGPDSLVQQRLRTLTTSDRDFVGMLALHHEQCV